MAILGSHAHRAPRTRSGGSRFIRLRHRWGAQAWRDVFFCQRGFYAVSLGSRKTSSRSLRRVNYHLTSLLRKFKTRHESHLSSPGNLPDTKPKWPPNAGYLSLTASATSPRFGNACPGKKGSFRALIRRVGTLMCRSQGLLLERIQ